MEVPRPIRTANALETSSEPVHSPKDREPTSLSAHMVAICSTWLPRRNSLRSGASGAV